MQNLVFRAFMQNLVFRAFIRFSESSSRCRRRLEAVGDVGAGPSQTPASESEAKMQVSTFAARTKSEAAPLIAERNGAPPVVMTSAAARLSVISPLPSP